ncbi:SMP-30/gluconolactonase/LRE family protein [Lentisalinibacter orientalis]|uniref:SMP-30/gluconolactonase/LRE family protein n=1 Tax=Lentisalinibacter orientalis TaxID=2992241 RepID=UPI00386B1158
MAVGSYRQMTEGLRFPEGPIAMPDGSVLLVEIARGTLSRVTERGEVEVVAETGGGPNGAAIGPDGHCYVCNNGGLRFAETGGLLIPVGTAGDDEYAGGSIQRICLDTGEVETLYTHCGDVPLRGPNDIVFDAAGGFWFTDLGRNTGTGEDLAAVYYALPDGSRIERALFPLHHANGIGLSPDESVLYVAETWTGRVYHYPLTAPGTVGCGADTVDPGRLLYGAPGLQLFDSLAVDGAGNVCVATLINGGITVIPPSGGQAEHLALDDPYTTNICFGGDGLGTAFVTLSGTGRLVSFDWPRPGLALNFLNR